MKKSFVFLSILSVFFFAAEVFAEAPKFGIGARAGYNFTCDGSMDVSAPGFGMVGNVDYSNNGSWMLGLNGTLQINKYISTEIGIDWIDSSRNEFRLLVDHGQPAISSRCRSPLRHDFIIQWEFLAPI